MKLFRQSLRQRTDSSRFSRLFTTPKGPFRNGSDPHTLLSFLLYTAFGVLAVIICFAGLSSHAHLVQKGQVSRIRITSDISFSYISEIQAAEQREAIRRKVPPVFLLDLQPFREFSIWTETLLEDLIEFARVPDNTPEELARLQTDEANAFIADFRLGNRYGVRASDLLTLYNQLGPERLQTATNEGLIILGEIFRQGVFEADAAFSIESGQRLSLFQVEDEKGQVQEVQILSEEEGLRTLRIQLAAMDLPRDSTLALFRILRAALSPNLIFDEERTALQVQKAQEVLPPARIEVAEGETLTEPNSRVSEIDKERLDAYRRALRDTERDNFGLNRLFYERAILTLLLVLGALFFLRTTGNPLNRNQRIFALSGGLILFNLLLLRLVIEFGDSALAEAAPLLPTIIPYLLPIILGPMIITILVGTRPGILAAGLIATFNAMMQGNSLAVLLVSQLACLVAISACRNIQLRSSLVRAGSLSGAVVAVGALLLGLRNEVAVVTVLYQITASIGIGLLSGILIVGVLPVLENLFKYTTDITLLELTDFNHPLLRKMQLEAPGSYHHSLMVANLAENAAAAIGANPLVCRVCALFHDVGKLTKPEYFTENQGSGHNPHIERSPSISALVIKSHVKEGVQMARQYQLPKVIIEVIQQHHGTSLIQYFYYKALQQQRSGNGVDSPFPNAPKIELDTVNEATYRYEGPIPQFTESAIVMLADSVEAASRSLRKVSQQNIEELIDKIFTARIEDRQLDDTPITFLQLAKIRKSFVFALMNMLHARIEYPDGPEKAKSRDPRGEESEPTPS
jgi:putative nucleotidyltransferase with HDIG domain